MLLYTFCTHRKLILNQVRGRSPAQLRYVTHTFDEMAEIIWDRFYSVSLNIPVKCNYYYSLFMTGQRSSITPTPDYLLPPYLTEIGFDKLKVCVRLACPSVICCLLDK